MIWPRKRPPQAATTLPEAPVEGGSGAAAEPAGSILEPRPSRRVFLLGALAAAGAVTVPGWGQRVFPMYRRGLVSFKIESFLNWPGCKWRLELPRREAETFFLKIRREGLAIAVEDYTRLTRHPGAYLPEAIARAAQNVAELSAPIPPWRLGAEILREPHFSFVRSALALHQEGWELIVSPEGAARGRRDPEVWGGCWCPQCAAARRANFQGGSRVAISSDQPRPCREPSNVATELPKAEIRYYSGPPRPVPPLRTRDHLAASIRGMASPKGRDSRQNDVTQMSRSSVTKTGHHRDRCHARA